MFNLVRHLSEQIEFSTRFGTCIVFCFETCDDTWYDLVQMNVDTEIDRELRQWMIAAGNLTVRAAGERLDIPHSAIQTALTGRAGRRLAERIRGQMSQHPPENPIEISFEQKFAERVAEGLRLLGHHVQTGARFTDGKRYDLIVDGTPIDCKAHKSEDQGQNFLFVCEACHSESGRGESE